MRKFFWGGMALLVVGAATVYWTANHAVKHPNSFAARWAVSVAQMGFPGSALHIQRHPRAVTPPAPPVEHEQCEEPRHCFPPVQAPETPTADIPATEPVEVIQVEPWTGGAGRSSELVPVEGETTARTHEDITTEPGNVVVTIPDTEVINPFEVEEAEEVIPVMPYAEEDLSSQTTAASLVCTWLWNVFGNGCSTTGPDTPPGGEEESEEPEAETDATMPQDHGCPDYHRYHCPRGCPYSGGCPYHHSPRPAYQPPVTPVQEEDGTEPATEPEPQPKQTKRTSRYTPFIDTMEFRPSDGPGYRVEDTAF